MDIYTTNGNIIRQEPNADGTTRVELEFLFDNAKWTRLYAMATYYLAFHVRLGIDYVIANHMGTRAVVQQADFTEAAQTTLVETLLAVKERGNLLLATAEATLFGQPPGPPVETNRQEALRRYQATQLDCPAFLEALVARFAP